MSVITLRFLAGAYHANPWGRHVNEGVVEWPPSPFRLARALADASFRRFPEWGPERSARAIELLAGAPSFALPTANESHVRLYMSSNLKEASKRQKILDAFAVVDRNSPVLVRLDPNAPVDAERLADLAQLLESLNYLGRSESWVEAGIQEADADVSWNCTPTLSEWESASSETEVERVACLRPPSSYLQQGLLPTVGKGKKARAKTWFESLCMSSGDIQAEGWSHHPALLWKDYARPRGALEAPKVPPVLAAGPKFAFARYSMTSNVLPRIETTLVLAERVRRHLMGINRRLEGGDPLKVSPLFSGKDGDGRPAKGHNHAFVIPRDDDGDGRLDHLEIWSKRPFASVELATLDAFRSIWQDGGRPDIEFLLTDLLETGPRFSATRWESVTPLVTGRHYRKGRGEFVEWLGNEIIRELSLQGLPAPVAMEWTTSDTTVPPVRWAGFTRSRKGQSASPGHGAILTFSQPVEGPFVLGALAHYGLGRFRRAGERMS